MTSPAMLRLMSDLRQIKQDPPLGCSASPCADDNLFVWNATIFGPDDTPWEGGIFQLKITFSEGYPAKPPRVRFASEMFHPNVFKDGNICLDIIQARARAGFGKGAQSFTFGGFRRVLQEGSRGVGGRV